jgi:hypothetical protein
MQKRAFPFLLTPFLVFIYCWGPPASEWAGICVTIAPRRRGGKSDTLLTRIDHYLEMVVENEKENMVGEKVPTAQPLPLLVRREGNH